jgi:hypothetical protein
MNQIERVDPTNKAIQAQITTAVLDRVADQATYTIKFGRMAAVTGVSAKGAEELYQQCAMKGLCPEMALERMNDHVVNDIWICDGVWRATWPLTGETYTIDARGSEPNSDANANRVAFGKAKRNAHLSAVPSVIREAFLDSLTKKTGKRVVDNEEYVNRQDRNPNEEATASNPATTARATGRRQSTTPAATETETETKTVANPSAPFQLIYAHIANKWKKVPSESLQDIFTALGEKTLPVYLETNTKEEAVDLIDAFYQNGGGGVGFTPEPTESEEQEVVTATEGEQAPLGEA